MVIIDQVTNETAARAYSQQGHGKILKPIQRPDTYQRLPEDVQLNHLRTAAGTYIWARTRHSPRRPRVAALVNYVPAAAGPCPSSSSTQGRNSYILTIMRILMCSCKAIMSPLCNSGMSLSCPNEQREIGHGMGDDERTRAEPHRSVGAG